MEQDLLITLSDGATLRVETSGNGAEEDVAFGKRTVAISELLSSVTSFASDLAETTRSLRFSRAAIEFGISFKLEPGGVTAVLVKASGEANLKLTLEVDGG